MSHTGNFLSTTLQRVKSLTRGQQIALAVAVVGAAVVLYFSLRPRDGVYPLRWTESTAGDLTVDLADNGVLEAETAINIAAPNVNYERKLIDLVPEGTIVKKNDVLAKFDTAQLEEKLEQLKHSGLGAEMQDAKIAADIRLADLKAALQTSKENAKLAELQFKTMAYSAQLERDAAQARLNNARNDIKVAENRIKQEENRRDVQIRQIQERIDQNKEKITEVEDAIKAFTVTAPEDGIVVYPVIKVSGLSRKVQTGDMLYKSQIFIIIPNLFKMTAQLEVSEEEIRKVKMGQKAELIVEAFKNSKFTGEVYRVDPLAHVKENNEFIKVFTVGVRIKERDIDKLRPGMNARVTILIAQYKKVPLLPVAAVVRDGDRSAAYVVRGEKIVLEPVEVLDMGRDQTVLKKAVEGRVIIPDAAMRTYLNTPGATLRDVKWLTHQD
ncbi:MAG: hypothetical protein B9S32_08240 [Verrucomicrobia bacterium Tous-C9LFEB]|nr:MAG: hypothetical protein B9S32_08240 [Verrucomicrobia bacterium Tous-C9LFEB]